MYVYITEFGILNVNHKVSDLTELERLCFFVMYCAFVSPMAVPTHCSCIWMFLAGMCVSLVAGTDCRKECALCVYHLLGQQSTISSLVKKTISINQYVVFVFF